MRRGSRQKSRERLISKSAFAIHNVVQEIPAARAGARRLARTVRSPFVDARPARLEVPLSKQRPLAPSQLRRRTTTSPVRKHGKLKRKRARKSSRWRNG